VCPSALEAAHGRMARREASSNRAPGSPPGDASSRRQTSRRYLNGALVLIGGLTSGFPHQGSLGSGGHGVPCGSTMFTKRVSRPVDGLDPYRGRRGREGRANSKKDLVTGLIRGFCALHARRVSVKRRLPRAAWALGAQWHGETPRPASQCTVWPQHEQFEHQLPELSLKVGLHLQELEPQHLRVNRNKMEAVQARVECFVEDRARGRRLLLKARTARSRIPRSCRATPKG
jgi:hypothetical protein